MPTGRVGWNQFSPLDYKNSTHQFIVWQGMLLLKNNPLYADVHEWMYRYWAQIGRGLWDADFLNPWYNGGTTKTDPRPMHNPGFQSHFYDPYTGTNLLGNANMTAFTYTMETATKGGKLFEQLNEDTAKNNGVDTYAAPAFYNLGLALHYFTDLSQPCHAHNFGALNWPQKMHSAIEVSAQEFIKTYKFDFTCKDSDKCFDYNGMLSELIDYVAKESVKTFEYPLGDEGKCSMFALAEDREYGQYSVRTKDQYSLGGTCFGPAGVVESCSSVYSPISYSKLKDCWMGLGHENPGRSIAFKKIIEPLLIKQIVFGAQQTARFILIWFNQYGNEKVKFKGPVKVDPNPYFPALDNPPSTCLMDSHCYWDRRINGCNCTFDNCDKSACKLIPGSFAKGLGENYGKCMCDNSASSVCKMNDQCDNTFKATGNPEMPFKKDDYINQCNSIAAGVSSNSCKFNSSSGKCECNL